MLDVRFKLGKYVGECLSVKTFRVQKQKYCKLLIFSFESELVALARVSAVFVIVEINDEDADGERYFRS